MRLHSAGVLPLLLCPFLMGPLTAQTAPGSDSPDSAMTLRVNVRSVVVDVVVTDKNNRAVTGLPKDSFQVFEDGSPQAITFFEQHEGGGSGAPGAPPSQPPQPLPPNTFTNIPAAIPADSVNVLLMDALNTPKEDQMYVHRQMVKYLATIPPGIRIGIFLLGNRLSILQGFTEDSAVLRKAIALAATNPNQSALLPTNAETNLNQTAVYLDESLLPAVYASESENSAAALQQFLDQQSNFQVNERVEMSLEALEQMARYLGGIPGRKNLMWFTSSVPLCMFATAEGDASSSGVANAKGDCPYYDRVKKTVDMLARAQVSVYPIESAGLALDPIIDASTPPITNAVSTGPTGSVYQGQLATELQVNTMQTGSRDRNLNHTTMDQIARDTGGRAVYNQNGLKEALAEDIDNGARYYTLAYTPKNLSELGKLRKIEIRIPSGKYNLAYRRGYLEDTPKQVRAAESAKVKDPLRPLMDRGMPNFTEVHYRMGVEPAASQPAPEAPRAGDNSALKQPFTRYGVDFVLAIDGLNLPEDADGVRRGKVEVALVAYSHDGKPLNWMVRFMGLVIKPEQYEGARKSGIPFHIDFDAPGGDVYLRSGVFDTSSNKAGTLEIPLSAVKVAAR